jgi:hypothetical protein
MADGKGVGNPLMKLGEEKLTQLLTQMLANEGFVTALQGAIQGALKAKGSMDKGLIAIFSAFNVPTVEDVSHMQSKLAELEEAVADLTRVVETLHERQGGGDLEKPARKNKKKSAGASAGD